jgi:phosphatidylglycerophosphatase A
MFKQTPVAFCLASGFFSGLAPKAPGTFGSLACLAFWLILSPSPALTASLALGFTLVGLWACAAILRQEQQAQNAWSTSGKDPQWIVIDEWAGLLIALIPVNPSSILQIACAFLLFRFFDVTKLGLVGKAELLPGAIGIMADDLVAGIAALCIFLFAQWAIPL